MFLDELTALSLENLKLLELVPNVHAENRYDSELKSNLVQKSLLCEEFDDTNIN